MAYFYNSLMYKLCKIYVWNRREDHFFQRNIRWTLVKLIFYLIEMNDSNSFRLLPSGEKMIVPMSFRLKGWLNLKEYQISTLFYRPPHENWICTSLHFSKKKTWSCTVPISLGDSTVTCWRFNSRQLVSLFETYGYLCTYTDTNASSSIISCVHSELKLTPSTKFFAEKENYLIVNHKSNYWEVW